MADINRIISYVSIRGNKIIADDRLLFELPGVTPRAFFDAAYAALDISYPRFFKMDNLSKTGFLAGELLLRGSEALAGSKPAARTIVLQTANSSLDTDILYQASRASMPSPSLFVYTLPNILIGELSIRHQIKGESACFIFDIFNAGFQAEYTDTLPGTGQARAAIAGWADFYGDTFEALFYITCRSGDGAYLPHTAENVDKIYNTP